MPVQRLGRSDSSRAGSSRDSCRNTRSARLISIRMAILLVILGGAVGSMWRYWWSGLIAQRFGETFPFGTLFVNIVGSTMIGVFSGLLTHVSSHSLATALNDLLVVGICGGLTTFSSFSLQTYNLILAGRWVSAFSNIVFSTGLCLGGVALGWQITQQLNFDLTRALWNFLRMHYY
jgi:CrcB protein